MSNIEILEKGVEYTVLHRTVDTPQPYIVAWKFHPQTMDWEQGHYFEDRESAFKWFAENDLCNCIHCDKQGCARTGRRTADCPGISAGWASAPDWRAER